jgi:hypothetical protein
MDTRSRRVGLLIPGLVLAGLVLVVLALLVTGRFGPPSETPSPSAFASATPAGSQTPAPSGAAGEATLLAVGDVAYCGGSEDELVGRLAARLPGTIALLGDNAYQHGSADDYANCFNPTWGGFLDRVRPVPGNHDYETREAAAYFAYFGTSVGRLGEGWYSYDVGSWHVIALNSECAAIRGCGRGSPELAWLIADVAAHPAKCTLAYWHHARYSSGLHGDNSQTQGLWQALSDSGADIVLQGHDHDYERMAPIDGIRSFVVGTGGRSLYDWPGGPGPHTEVRANDTYGLLQLTLGATHYSWKFIPVGGGTFTDAGSGTCH